MLVTSLAIIVLATGLWVGLPGILSGGKVLNQRGPEHLMHYPVSVPWFRGKVNTARWVVRTGRFFAGGALLLATVMLTIAWWPSGENARVSPCIELTPLADISKVAGMELSYGNLLENEHRCELEVQTTSDQAHFLQIEVDAPKALIGASLESQRHELERRSMKLRPLPTLGSDAVVAIDPRQPNSGAVFLFTHAGATVRVQTRQTEPGQVKFLARIFAQKRTKEG